MILHPGSLALISGAAIALIMVLAASVLGAKILDKWDIKSSLPGQLALERKTYLVSSLLNCVLLFEVASIFLFVFTTDAMHVHFTGAMCSTGTLNANPIGWYVIYLKIFLFFGASIWATLNHFDQRAADFPIIKLKYALLLLLLPFLAGDLFLLIKFFSGLNPEVITSCCGSLFSEESSGLAGELTALPPKLMIFIYYVAGLIMLIVAVKAWRGVTAFWRTALLLLSVGFFFVTMAAIISFISLYIYEMPTHHCPFDMLQKHYSFIGYPIYWSLFAGVFFGMIPGLLQPLHKKKSLRTTILATEKKCFLLSLLHIAALLLITSWPIVFGEFIYF